MVWRIAGTFYSACNCHSICPCLVGATEGTFDECFGAVIFNIREGQVGETDVSGTRMVMVSEWPHAFVQGNGKGRLYFDPAMPSNRRSLLEAVFSGQEGGLFEALATLLPTWLPSLEATIDLRVGTDSIEATVGEYGRLTLKAMRGADGQLTRLLNAPVGLTPDAVVANGAGSDWKDPGMQAWASGGHGEYSDFDWSA